MPEDDCFLYFIKADGSDLACKVGVSSKPQNRLAQLQTGNPMRLSIHAVVRFNCRAMAFLAESAMKAALAKRKTSGEWFSVAPVDAVKIYESIKAMLDLGDFHPDDFLGLCEMTAHQTIGWHQ